MHHILIDTTVLRNDPGRRKAAFRSLSHLIESRKIKLHIPDMVRREFISQQRSKYNEQIDKLGQALKQLRRCVVPSHVITSFDDLSTKINRIEKELHDYAKNDFDKWTKSLRAEIHLVNETHGPKVVNAYFEGTAPFREPKRRDDFPDAFIWQVVLDLVDSVDKLHLVSSDQGFHDAANSHEKIDIYNSLDAFINSDLGQQMLQEYFSGKNVERLISLISQKLGIINSAIEHDLVDRLANETVHDNAIPEDNSEAGITSVGQPTNLDLDVSNYKDYGSGLFVLPFSLRVECLLNYCIFKADYYALSDEKSKYISISECNDHYYDAEEDYELDVMGSIALKVDPDELAKEVSHDIDLEYLLKQADISIDSIAKICVVDD